MESPGDLGDVERPPTEASVPPVDPVGVLLGVLLAAFGTDLGDHVGGLVFLVVLLPGLFALWRWAWPRTP